MVRWIVLLLLFASAGAFHFASAQSAVNGFFIVRPSKVELSVSPGEKRTTEITVANGTPAPLSVEILFEDVDPNLQNSAVDEPLRLLGGNTGSRPLKDWLSVPKRSFEILSGKEMRIPVTLSVPKDSDPGGRFGSIVFRFHPVLPDGTRDEASVMLESRIATVFFVRVEGNVIEEGKLAAFGLFNDATMIRTPSTAAPLRLQVAYENTGTVHLNPYGRITLTPSFGDARVIAVDPFAVLPGATRMREVSSADPLSVGFYRAHIELNRGYGDVVDEEEVTFWVVPGTTGLVLILLGLILFALLIRRSLTLSKHFVR